MDKVYKMAAIDDFVHDVEGTVSEIRQLLSFLQLDDNTHKKALYASLDIVSGKMTDISACNSVRDAKKYIRAKKVIEEYGES